MLLLLLMLWLEVTSSVVGFNLEPRIAIVKRGRPGSYFGYSVTQHQIVRQNKIQSLALVGAPVDNSGQPGTNRTGLVWSCPLTQSSLDCSPLRDVVPGHDAPPRYDEKRDDQWLGVSVNSQGPGKKVIVCAHRYVRQGRDFSWGQGACYTLTQFLGHEATWEPCHKRDTTGAHEQWGYCQAGTSAMIADDDTALIGTPGPYTWRGTIFALSTSDDYLFRDNRHYHSPISATDCPVDKYSYLGMAVAAGNFLPPARSCGEYLSYAAGAPRANSTGQVIIFVKCHSELLNVQMVLSGSSFASQFGYALAAADVNGDGFKDLFVAAPFDNTREQGGAVYYYKNSVGGIDPSAPPTVLRGAPLESRFGFAVSSAGDVNADGYTDIVIGAPYEGRGAVYLYHGGPQGLSTVPSQIVRSEQLPGPPIRTFGYSLSGGLDLDMNNHTDVLVGAYASDAAVVLRARPVIDILTWFTGAEGLRVNPTYPGCDGDPTSPEVCFQLESCFQIRNFPTNIETTNVKYRVQAETFKGGRKFSRVRFDTSTKEIVDVMEKRVQVRKHNLDGCFRELVYLKEGTLDIRSPLRFLVEYSLGQDEPSVQGDVIPNINQFPILNMNEASKVLEIPFHKDCGLDEECQSYLSAELEVFGDSTSTEDEGMETGLESALELGEGREIVVNLTVSNTGDPAYTAAVNLNFSEIFSYVGRSDDAKNILCELKGDVSISCNLGNPFSKGTEHLQFKFVPLYSTSVPSDVMFTVNLTTSSINPPSLMTRSRQFRVVRRSEVSIRASIRPQLTTYGGKVVGESSITTIPEIGSRVLHTFHVVNDGPWPSHNLQVNIDWPFQVENGLVQGKWLLYLTDPVELSPQGIGRCYLNPRHVNSLGLRRKNFNQLDETTDDELNEPVPFYSESDSMISDQVPNNNNNGEKVPSAARVPYSDTTHSSRHHNSEGSLKYSSAVYNKISRHESTKTSGYSYQSVITGEEEVNHKIRERREGSVRRRDSEGWIRRRDRVRRDTEGIIPPDYIVDEASGRTSRVVVFDCGRSTAKCLTISCDLPRLYRGEHAVIRLRSRVWNSTLVEDYPRVDSVLINVAARLSMPPDLANQQDQTDDEVTVGVVAYPDGLGDRGLQGVPVWIMVTAIVAGLLLVLIITAILWKFGFFQRKRVSDVTQSAKIGKNEPLLRRGDEYIS